MQAVATLKMLRSTPQKTRLVADLIRGLGITEAENILRYANRRAAKPLLKLLQSAKANAVNNHDMFEDSLFVARVEVNEGPTLKRYLPRARGRADLLRKRTSHITITLEERSG
ncbi:MAG: 50S ribosomal protein L22 [Trueperaceae bacterium]|nr:MAG: 50S ribosomal protein L22 [Trueperaceae bacterium]